MLQSLMPLCLMMTLMIRLMNTLVMRLMMMVLLGLTFGIIGLGLIFGLIDINNAGHVKKDKALMDIAWTSSKYWDWCMQEGEKKRN